MVGIKPITPLEGGPHRLHRPPPPQARATQPRRLRKVPRPRLVGRALRVVPHRGVAALHAVVTNQRAFREREILQSQSAVVADHFRGGSSLRMRVIVGPVRNSLLVTLSIAAIV